MWKISAPLRTWLSMIEPVAAVGDETRFGFNDGHATLRSIDRSHMTLASVTVDLSCFETADVGDNDECFNPEELVTHLRAALKVLKPEAIITITMTDRLSIEAQGFQSGMRLLDSSAVPNPKPPTLGHDFDFHLDQTGLAKLLSAMESIAKIGSRGKDGRNFSVVFESSGGVVSVGFHDQDKSTAGLKVAIGNSDRPGRGAIHYDGLSDIVKAMPSGTLKFRIAATNPHQIDYDGDGIHIHMLRSPVE